MESGANSGSSQIKLTSIKERPVPYIEQTERAQYAQAIKSLVRLLTAKPIGHLNYVITRLILARWTSNPGYTTGNEIVGCMTCARDEFRRRHLDGYEDQKRMENGDVTIRPILHPWSPQEHITLRRLVGSDIGIEEIALRLTRSEDDVILEFARLKLHYSASVTDSPRCHGGAWSNAELATVQLLRERGRSIAEVAHLLERTPTAIIYQLATNKKLRNWNRKMINDG
jgi:hypothetical protein